MLKIDNKQVKAPSKLQVDLYTIDGESTRNAKGEMIRDVIATKRKLNLEWKTLTPEELSSLLKSIDKPFFSVEYPDPQEGELITKTFYVGDRSLPIYQVKEEQKWINGKLTVLYHPTWTDITFNFVEK